MCDVHINLIWSQTQLAQIIMDKVTVKLFMYSSVKTCQMKFLCAIILSFWSLSLHTKAKQAEASCWNSQLTLPHVAIKCALI